MEQSPTLTPTGGLGAAAADDGSRRACDQCRSRKIRCDKDWPCSNCRTAKRTCTSIGMGPKPKEPRQRVLISSQYERKIDQIENRLASIETLLKDLASRPSNSPESSGPRLSHTPQTVAASAAFTTATASVACDSSDSESAFGGDATLAAQTSIASEFLEHAVERTSLHDVNPKMRDALVNLRQLVELQNKQSISHGPRFPLQQPIPPGGLGQMPMPPMDAVVNVLKRTRALPPGLFTFICYIVGVMDFSSLCRMIYFPTEDFSDATFIIVNVGLYYLFLEQHSMAVDKASKQEFEQYIHIASVNLETALANMNLFVPNKVDTIQALLLGTMYAIDASRPSVAWHLNSAAIHACQAAGFHRKGSSEADTEESKKTRGLFWHLYTTDKALGLRLGRAPTIVDWDIDIPRTFSFEGLLGEETAGMASMWLMCANLQGEIYKQLYSPAALARPPHELEERARGLAAQCRTIEQEATQTRDVAIAMLERIKASHLVDSHVRGDEVQLLSTMTLVYRAIPAPEGSISKFCDECIDVARRAITKHLQVMELVSRDAYAKTLYVHWNLMLAPFTPFFVIFCFVIETSSMDDLALIQNFTKSLEEASDSSETIRKIGRLFRVMTDVAMLYVEAKSQQQDNQGMVPIGNEFDMYLNQLGFMPMPMDVQASLDPSDPGSNGMAFGSTQVAQMADWFSGSRNMMGLLEHDLSHIGGPG